MLKQCFVVSALIFSGLQAALADTIQLKDKAAVSGKILTEKRDQIAVDIGYTVLVIPRSEIAKVSRAETPELPATKALASPKAAAEDKDFAESRASFYSRPSSSAAPCGTNKRLRIARR